MRCVSTVLLACMPLRMVTPRPAVLRTDPVRLVGGLERFLVGKNVVQGRSDLQKAESMLKLMARAATARGKADVEAVRALATLVGAGDDMDAFAASIGLDLGNSSSGGGGASDVLMDGLLGGLGTTLTAKLEGKPERRLALALSITCAVLLCEAVQLFAVLTAAWLLGAATTLGGALGVALRSRTHTRPLRLLCEVWLAQSARRFIDAVPPRRRLGMASRASLAVLAAAVVGVALLTGADALACGSGWAGAAASWRHLSGAPRPSSSSPLAIGASAVAHACASALAALPGPFRSSGSSSQLINPVAVADATNAACTAVRELARALVEATISLAHALRRVKPLNALLDLSETDEWLQGALAAASLGRRR